MPRDLGSEAQWLAVIAKSLAVLAMHRSELGTSEIVIKAEFLEGLGLPRSEVARMLGTTPDSPRVMSARKKKGGNRGLVERYRAGNVTNVEVNVIEVH
jgi:hypothetical protein